MSQYDKGLMWKYMVDRIKYSITWVLVSTLFSRLFVFFFLIPLSPRRVICRYLFMWFHCTASALNASYALWITALTVGAHCILVSPPVYPFIGRIKNCHLAKYHRCAMNISRISANYREMRNIVASRSIIQCRSLFTLILSRVFFSLEKLSNYLRKNGSRNISNKVNDTIVSSELLYRDNASRSR